MNTGPVVGVGISVDMRDQIDQIDSPLLVCQPLPVTSGRSPEGVVSGVTG